MGLIMTGDEAKGAIIIRDGMNVIRDVDGDPPKIIFVEEDPLPRDGTSAKDTCELVITSWTHKVEFFGIGSACTYFWGSCYVRDKATGALYGWNKAESWAGGNCNVDIPNNYGYKLKTIEPNWLFSDMYFGFTPDLNFARNGRDELVWVELKFGTGNYRQTWWIKSLTCA